MQYRGDMGRDIPAQVGADSRREDREKDTLDRGCKGVQDLYGEGGRGRQSGLDSTILGTDKTAYSSWRFWGCTSPTWNRVSSRKPILWTESTTAGWPDAASLLRMHQSNTTEE